MLYKQRLQDPYYDDGGMRARGRATFEFLPSPGVYQIFKRGKLRYVGYSGTSVYKAMYRHFQKWTDSNQIRVTYDHEAVKVRVTYTNTAAQAYALEKALIIKKRPPDNPQQYHLNYDTDKKEDKIYSEFINEPTRPIVTTGKIPF